MRLTASLKVVTDNPRRQAQQVVAVDAEALETLNLQGHANGRNTPTHHQ